MSIYKAENIYWTDSLELFRRLSKNRRVSFSKYTLATPYQGSVLTYGSLDPYEFPYFYFEEENKVVLNCTDEELDPIPDCLPSTTFYLGYVRPFSQVTDPGKFYLFQGNTNSQTDMPVLLDSEFVPGGLKMDEFLDEAEFDYDFGLLGDEDLSASIQIKGDLPEIGSTLIPKSRDDNYLVYYIFLDEDGISVPSWTRKYDSMVMIIYKQIKGGWKLLRKPLIKDLVTGEIMMA